MKRKGMKLFPKTFLYSLSLILTVVLLSYCLFYLLMPRFYYAYKKEELSSRLSELSALISHTKESQVIAPLYEFTKKTDMR